MKFGFILLAIHLLLACQNMGAAQSASLATSAPAEIELRDQFDEPQRLSFPATNVTILTIADRKGSEEVDGWIAALKPLFAGRVDFRGLADVAGVPGLLHARLRAQLREKRKYPVMLDWSGNVCAQFGYRHGTANILIIDRDGRIRLRLGGKATSDAVASVRVAVEAALSSRSQVSQTLAR